MCIRTKTSYGCGCIFKDDEPCVSKRCRGFEKYHYQHEGDCRSCRNGGHEVTRGREGKGRYAKEINKRSPTDDVSGGASPWMPAASNRREKEWQSPTRREADSAWEDEHSSRIEDLQNRLEKMSMPSHSPPRAASPEPIDDHYYSNESDLDLDPPPRPKLFAEVSRGSRDDYSSTTRRRRDPRSRHEPNDSYESFDSLPHQHRNYPPRPRSYKDGGDPYDSGYGSHSSYRSAAYVPRRPGLPHSQSAGLYLYGAKTEPRDYAYSLPRSRTYEVPISTGYGGYTSPIGAYGVELSPSGRARVVTRPY